jgi:hypothetical protein
MELNLIDFVGVQIVTCDRSDCTFDVRKFKTF